MKNKSSRTVVQLLDFVPHGWRSVEQFLSGLTENLNERGWRSVYVFSGEPSEAFRERLRDLDAPFLLSHFPLSRVEATRLADELRQYQPDVLQTHFMSPFNLALPKLKRSLDAKHLVITDRTSGSGNEKRGPRRWLAQARGAFACSYVDRVVTVSEFIRRRDIDRVFFPADIVRAIHNGVDLERFSPCPEPPDHDATTIAFAGQLIPEKGVDLLLQAIRTIVEESAPRLKVLIAGVGGQAQELRDYCDRHQLTQVEFLGQIDWVPRLYSSADIVVAPSVWEEACAFSVIEALACGGCVIASDAGGNPELVGTDGETGLIFKNGDVGGLVQTLRALIADPDRRARLGRNARARALAHFSLARMVDDYAAILEELEPANRAVPALERS